MSTFSLKAKVLIVLSILITRHFRSEHGHLFFFVSGAYQFPVGMLFAASTIVPSDSDTYPPTSSVGEARYTLVFLISSLATNFACDV
jgi:hypothetical protein